MKNSPQNTPSSCKFQSSITSVTIIPSSILTNRVEEGEIVPPDPPAQNVLQHVTVQEERAHLVLQQAKAHDSGKREWMGEGGLRYNTVLIIISGNF